MSGAFDRLLATRFGVSAVRRPAKGEPGVRGGLRGGEVSPTPPGEVVLNKRTLDLDLPEVARVLAG
jgi:6-phosphofructokinase 1